MALKNTYAKLPAGRYIQSIEDNLVRAGVIGMQKGYEEGRITSLAFILDLSGNKVHFKLPIAWKKVQQVLKNEGAGRADDDDYAYKVSWAIMNDWVEAQLAILATETVSMPQLFLAYAVGKDGNTLFENMAKNPSLLLGGE